MRQSANLEWFRQARFGMFIHWGIYSLLEAGEWVMYQRQIPVKEYEKLAERFNPVAFDADEWVSIAKRAGMKYIVITAKHHDGFSMFKTDVSGFNVVDATPFGRDPMRELCEACRRQGLRLGFYYSHVREWRHPMAQSFEVQGRPDRLGNYGNFWDYPNENCKNLQKYIDEFDLPQLRELLTQYGDILTIWFDTPSMISPAQGEQIRDYVHAIQPDCLVNSRLSDDIETDYRTMGDCEVPSCGAGMAWDTPMTSSESWGYKANDKYRTANEFIRELSDIASKGGNYLLNVGPDARGVIPEAACAELAKVGKWLEVNGEAIFGTGPAQLRYTPKWGYVTRRDNVLYAIVSDESARSIRLTGLMSEVTSCRMLGGSALRFTQRQTGDLHELSIELGQCAGDVRVVAIECAAGLSVCGDIMPGDDDSIELYCIDAALHADSPYSKLMLQNGATRRWWDARDWLEWSFITTQPGAEYDVRLILEDGGFWRLEDFGHEVELLIDGERLAVTVSEQAAGRGEKGRRYLDAGRVILPEKGMHSLQVRPRSICCRNMAGLTMFGVALSRPR